MSVISTDSTILKVEALQTKFDLSIVSNSLVNLIGSYLEARIVQQLHYWTVHEYGKVINGLRWIYKPAREWLSETLIGFTNWQLRTAIASLIEKGILLREHLFKEHHGNNFAPKNRTYYYSLNYEGLEKFAQNQKIAESPENIRFVSETNQFGESSENQFCESTKNITKNTSTENISRDQSRPTLPCEWEREKEINQEKQEINQEKQEFSNPELLKIQEVNSVNPKVIEQDTNIGQVEEKINQYKNTSSISTQVETEKLQQTDRPSPKLRVNLSKQKREDKAPWKDEAEKSQFYRALIQALPIVANSHSPQGLAKTIMAQLKRGEEHTYWDDFKAGLPIGSSTKPEWEIEPGVPYPMFVEYLTEKIKAGNNTQTNEQARNEVFRILNQPRQASAFWGQFKRSVVNVSEQVERDRALGVSNPSTPVWTRERIEPSIEEAAAAGDKIRLVNGAVQTAIEAAKTPKLESKSESPTPDPWTDDESQLTMREILATRGIKGFVKSMPKVSREKAEVEERKQKPRKNHVSQMSVAEINNYLTDPILKAQIMPQLWHSDYELITDEWGEIIGVKAPPPAEE